MVEDFDSSRPHCLDPLDDRKRIFGRVMDAFQTLHARDVGTTYPKVTDE